MEIGWGGLKGVKLKLIIKKIRKWDNFLYLSNFGSLFLLFYPVLAIVVQWSGHLVPKSSS